jgi:hypothetical protein
MKPRLLLIALLVLSTGPAYGEWIAIDQNTQLGLTTYFDPDTIRRTGDRVKMWVLHDFKTIQTIDGDSYLSIKGQREYDCAEERERAITFTQFSGNMGSGKVVLTALDERRKWEPVQPGSVGQTLWNFACDKK